MLIESPRRLILLTSNREGQAVLPDGDAAAEQNDDRQTVSWWDKVAERWPDGGRFPSFIFTDQSA